MSSRSNRHIEYYLSLVAILALGMFLVIVVSPNKNLQMFFVLLTTLFYVIFGIFHHLINHDLGSKIVLEYLLIGSLGIAVVFFILKGGFGI
ncbi:MAG: hypothetical protein M1372_03210 [Patescibacteria group bacterium]|nr:hypothetical protein [Patescibacteria group bacterium]MCL5114138.1 hypothetical protein [Patescibacteria group bacterium]